MLALDRTPTRESRVYELERRRTVETGHGPSTAAASDTGSGRLPEQNDSHNESSDLDVDILPSEKQKELDDDGPNDGIDYPEGGWKAWGVCFGSFCAMLVTFGFSNAMGTIQSWLLAHQLSKYSESQIAWIFSLWLFCMFTGSVITGPIFDAYGARILVLPGSILYILSVMMLSLCSQYWHFILGFSLLGGISCSMIFNPCVSVVGHYFYRRRAFATGLSFSGGAIGGIMFPLSLTRLFEKVGYGWAIRIIGFVILFLLVICCLLVDARKLRDPSEQKVAALDLKAVKDIQFLFICIAVFMLEWAFFGPVNYLVLYSEQQAGMDASFSNSLVAILNAGSVLGRAIPGYLGDKTGPFNMGIAMNFMTGLLTLTVWLTVGHKKAGLIAYAALFGFFSGSCLSLIPACIGRISDTRQYGTRFGTCYFIASAATLTGLPICGALKGSDYTGTIAFTGAAFIVGSLCYLVSRLSYGNHRRLKY